MLSDIVGIEMCCYMCVSRCLHGWGAIAAHCDIMIMPITSPLSGMYCNLVVKRVCLKPVPADDDAY